MDRKFKQDIIKLGVFMLIAAIIPCFILLVPLLPDVIHQIVLLGTTVVYPLFCCFVLIWGSLIIWALPVKKFFRRLIFIVWLSFYVLLCWAWATLAILLMMQIYGHV